jgi:plastocyanin
MKATVAYGKIMAILLLVQVLLAGCGLGPRDVVSVREVEGEKTIKMEAGGFYFEPAIIQALAGDILLVEIENVAGGDHNFTVENPAGEIMLSIDLPGNSTRTARLSLPAPGVYQFYCDITLHPALGMTGRIEVE